MFNASKSFSNQGKASASRHFKKNWVKTVGAYYYYSLILANFNPVIANQIFDNPAHVIAEAFVSKMAYEHVEVK
jgi:hypothetical protein